MPRPLAEHERFEINISPGVVRLAPEAATEALNVIAIWSDIEATMGGILASMIGGRAPEAVTMYNALRATNVQREAAIAVAREHFPEEQADIFTSIVRESQDWSEERNRFAHWVWAWTPRVADALLLLPPSERVAFDQRVATYASERSRDVGDPENIPLPDFDRFLVYTRHDLEALTMELIRIRALLEHFRVLTIPEAEPLHAPAIARLMEDQGVARRVERMRQRRQNGNLNR